MLKLRADAVDWRNIDGEIVALDVRSSIYLAINRSGARLWPMFVEGTDRDALVERLVDQYGVAPREAADDVGAFVDALRERGLLEAASETAED